MRTSRRGLFGLAAGIATAAVLGPGLRPSETSVQPPAGLRVQSLYPGGFLVSPELLADLKAYVTWTS